MRVGVLFSGRGSNLGALVRATIDPDYPAQIVIAISNQPNAGGLEMAEEHNVDHRVVDHADYETREEHEEAITAVLEQAKVELVCLAGYMRILTDTFVTRWRGKLINIHPSLLPAFRGVDTHARALEAGVRIHGCSVHFVTAELDTGPIIAQAAVPVMIGDTDEALANRVLQQEHVIYPACVAMIARGDVRWGGGDVVVGGEIATDGLSFWGNAAPDGHG